MSVRTYRLWTRADGLPQSGHGALGRRPHAVIVIRSPLVATCSTRSSAGEGHSGDEPGMRHLRGEGDAGG